MTGRLPDATRLTEYEVDGPGTFNTWCLRCRKAKGGLSSGEVDVWAVEHACICPLCDGPEHDGECPEDAD